MTSSGTCNFPKLNDNTAFSNWKFRVKVLLEERSLASILNKYDKTNKENVESDAKARSIIVQCVTDRYLNIIKKCKTAADMLSSLEEVFERKSVFNKLFLRKKLIAMKCSSSQSLQDHFLQFDNLITQLETAGTTMEDSDKLTHLFLTLPEEYSTVITTLETMSIEKELTVDFVKSRLLDSELKFKEKKSDVVESSFYTCYKCGKEGHMAYQCDKKPDNNYQVQRGRGKFRMRSRGRSAFRGKSRGQGHVAQVNDNSGDMFIASSMEHILHTDASEIIFIVDSGATHNFIQEKYEKYMTNVTELQEPIKVKIANGEVLQAKKKGYLRTFYEGDTPVTTEGLIVSGIESNLLSVNELMNKGKSVIFQNGELIIKSHKRVYNGEKKGKLYILKMQLPKEKYKCYYSDDDLNNGDLWHIKLGHLNRKALSLMNLPYSKKVCEVCMKNKSTRLPFKTVTKQQSKYVGELIHSDVAGPMKISTNEGYRYYQTILDDYSHFTQTYLLVNKSEAADNLIKYIREIETEKELKIKRIRCDNGGEYSSNYFRMFCERKGIKIEYTVPYSPQMNGKSERLNRSIYDKARTILDESCLPRHLWGHAILTATFLINRCPSSAIDYEIPAVIFEREMVLNKLKPFGCKGWMVILPKRDKLDSRAKEVRMVGYARNGYKVWDSITDTVTVTRDVRFNERDFKYQQAQINEQEDDNVYIEEKKDEEQKKKKDEEQKKKKDEEERKRQEEENKINEKSKRNEEQKAQESTRQNTRSGRLITKPKHLSEYEIYEAYCLISTEEDPQEFKEAMENGWEEAIKTEIQALQKMNTWTETDLPENKKAIDTKWVFKTKENNLKKARLVVKGFQLKEDSDFGKNYAPVARISSVRTILAHAIQKGWNLRQLDVPTAFLNGMLESEVYIKLPEGVKATKNKVLKLNRGLYGLRESPKCWNQRFNSFAVEKGFKRSQYDVCLYIGETMNVWMLIYVDDIILTGIEEEIEKMVKYLKMEFQTKDFGYPKSFLGMEIEKKEDGLKITQKRQIENMLIKYNMQECKSSNTPLTKGYQFDENEPIISDIPYRQLIGSLMFVSTVSRPDITYSTSYLSQYLDKPTQSLWIQAKRVLRYLKGSQDTGLYYTKSGNMDSIETYSDADWGGSHTDRKSVSGSMTLYNGCPVAWFSRKQACVSLSTVEAEYVAAATSACDLLYIKGLYSDLNGLESDVLCILYMDNRGAIQISKSVENSKRAKHIDIKYHFLKDVISRKLINVEYISTHNNVADLLTKTLSGDKLQTLKQILNIVQL